MLRSLHIENYVLIDSLDVDFPEGLIIITGQTGAGKSILIGALSLLGGAKADATAISAGAQNCVVEAEFDCSSEQIRSILEANEVEWDGGHLIVRRVVSVSGRSRCFVNDSPVPVGVLSQLSANLIDIHSQHQSLLLTDRNFQLSLLDHFCSNGKLLDASRECWRKILSLRGEIDSLERSADLLSRDREYNESQYAQLEAARLKDGELEELEAESRRLENAQLIKETLAEVSSLMPSSLKEASRSLEKISKYLPQMAQLAERLDSARIELDDIAEELERCDERVDMSPERLETVEERLSTLYSLMKKHSCSSVAELIAVKERYAGTLGDSSSLDERLQELKKDLESATKEYGRLCVELHSSRQAGAVKFAAEVCGSLHYLELERAVFDVVLSESAPCATGTDSVTFRFSASGTNPADVSRCASGGELSRIMLSLKSLMAEFSGMPTMIFDEIDTGVSGSVADKMGSMICGMGTRMQVFAITHLPQVAAKGDAHYVVTKTVSDNGHAVSSIAPVGGDARVEEIARMLSGANITSEAVANAKSLLNGN